MHQFIHQAELLIAENRLQIEQLLADESEGSFLHSYEQYIQTRELQTDGGEHPGKLKLFASALADLFTKVVPKHRAQALTRVGVNSGISATTIAVAEKTHGIPVASDVFKLATGLVFAAYSIYIALLMTSAAEKARNGAKDLEALAASLVSYVNLAPETAPIAKEIIEKLIEGIKTTGQFNVDDLIRLTEQLTSTDIIAEIRVAKLDVINTQLNSLREACRLSVSPGMRKVVEVGGALNISLAALSGDDMAESMILSGITAAVVSAIQEVLYDLDKPWGEGSISFSTEPLETALALIAFTGKEAELKTRIGERLNAKNRVNANIVNSFYRDFRVIFDPWFAAKQEADQAQSTHLEGAFFAAGQQGHSLEAIDISAINGRAAAIGRRVLEESNVAAPQFLFGDEVGRQGNLNMQKQLSFRHNDEPRKQLALVEATITKVREADDMDETAQRAAITILNAWIKRLNAEKEMIKDGLQPRPQSKSIEQVKNEAVRAIVGEIETNIATHGRATYVFRRREGTANLPFETANRGSDWMGVGQQVLLTPIHTEVIAQLTRKALEDTVHADKYHSVIADINRVRQSQGLPEIVVAA